MDERDSDLAGAGYLSAVVLVGVLGWVGWLALGPHDQAATPGPPALKDPTNIVGSAGDKKDDVITRFDEFLATHEPKVVQVKRHDLVDGQEFDVPSVDFHNLVGGTTSDMMWLALGTDPQNNRRPYPGIQEWQAKLGTSPTSLATYMEVEFINVQAGRTKNNAVEMKDWDLAKLCPPLANLPQAQWTDDERNYVHYFTIRQMGFDDTECGFSALWAAYASNFSLWKGSKRAVPAAAFYALAAARFEQALAAGGPPDARATTVTWMLCGELHRLLGQLDAAQRCFAAADKRRGLLQEPERQTLEFYQDLLKKKDTDLQRLPFTHVPEPPIGWFVDYLLPAINGDLQVERANWNSYTTPEEIEGAINAVIAAQAPAAAR